MNRKRIKADKKGTPKNILKKKYFMQKKIRGDVSKIYHIVDY
jgi:hypothetical protein